MKKPGYLTACFLALICPLQAEPDNNAPHSPEAIRQIEFQAASAISQIRPQEVKGRELQKIELKEGWVYWGNLLGKDDMVAFTSLQQRPTDDERPDYPLPYLCYFVWEGDHWKLRQFLGHGTDLEFHVREERKERYLQASCLIDRHNGEEHSWRYDPETKLLVPTDLDDRGRFWIAGNYICYPRGLERLAHDSNVWIYRFEQGKRGELLASLHEVDNGQFTVGFRDPRTGKMHEWRFDPVAENRVDAPDFEVRIDPDEARAQEPDAQIFADESGSLESHYAFALLTGLNTELLENKWMDVVPGARPIKRIPMKATGHADVVRRFAWQPPPQERASEAAAAQARETATGEKALQAVAEIVPAQTKATGALFKHSNRTICFFSRMFGDQKATAIVLVPHEQSEGGAHVVLLLGEEKWKVQQYLGVTLFGIPKLHSTYNPQNSYVTIEQEHSGKTSRLWRCDQATQKLTPVDLSEGHSPTISGDVLTLSSWGPGKVFFRLNDRGRELLAKVDHASISVSHAKGKTETWRLNEVSGGNGKGRALFTVWVSEEQSTSGRDVGRIESDWNHARKTLIMKHLTKRVVGLTSRQYTGVWDDDAHFQEPADLPLHLKVEGSQSFVELLEPVAKAAP